MRLLVTVSFFVYALTFHWRAVTFEPEMDFAAVALPQFIQGIAVACFFMPLTTITLSGLKPEETASASSLFNFLRTLAGSVGTSLTTFMWYNREALHHGEMVENITPYNPASQQYFHAMAEKGLNETQTAASLANQITHQGLIIGANEIFYISAIAFMLLFVIIWLAKPPFGARH